MLANTHACRPATLHKDTVSRVTTRNPNSPQQHPVCAHHPHLYTAITGSCLTFGWGGDCCCCSACTGGVAGTRMLSAHSLFIVVMIVSRCKEGVLFGGVWYEENLDHKLFNMAVEGAKGAASTPLEGSHSRQ